MFSGKEINQHFVAAKVGWGGGEVVLLWSHVGMGRGAVGCIQQELDNFNITSDISYLRVSSFTKLKKINCQHMYIINDLITIMNKNMVL